MKYLAICIGTQLHKIITNPENSAILTHELVEVESIIYNFGIRTVQKVVFLFLCCCCCRRRAPLRCCCPRGRGGARAAPPARPAPRRPQNIEPSPTLALAWNSWMMISCHFSGLRNYGLQSAEFNVLGVIALFSFLGIRFESEHRKMLLKPRS